MTEKLKMAEAAVDHDRDTLDRVSSALECTMGRSGTAPANPGCTALVDTATTVLTE